jgi:DNA (cytosine-5)-methyltransferase 1
MTRPIAVDLFAGAGGLSLGFEQAGFDIAAALEIDPIHASVHKFNFPYCEVLPLSVVGLPAKKVRSEAQLGNRPVHLVIGGAPCQGFSLIGYRAFDDPRNLLVKEFVRLVAELDAAYFVFENVQGLTVGRHRQFLDELIHQFRERNYDVRLDWRVLNAANFGVPQDRRRLFLLGAQRGLPLPEYPPELTRAAGMPGDGKLAEGPTCRDALSDLPEAEDFIELTQQDWVQTDEWGCPSGYARELRGLNECTWWYGYRRKANPRLLSSSMRTAHSDISRRRFAATIPGETEPISRFFKLPADGVSNTLRAGTDSARGAFTSPRPIHYEKPRCVTVREMARLHGFPDWFRFHATKWHGARQIGNAVSPIVAREVALKVAEALGYAPTRPSTVIEFGDPALLTMDMSRAAAYWQVVTPIGRRDRKSGAKKRKQHEIELAMQAE